METTYIIAHIVDFNLMRFATTRHEGLLETLDEILFNFFSSQENGYRLQNFYSDAILHPLPRKSYY